MLLKDSIDQDKLAYSAQIAFITILRCLHPLHSEIEKRIIAGTKLITYKKGEYLTTPNNEEKFIFFINKGLVRGYIKDGKHEATIWLAKEGEVLSRIVLYNDNETEEYIQAVERAEVLIVPQKLIEYLYDNFTEANFIGRKIMERNYQSAQERAYIGRLSSAEKKYSYFLKTYTDFMNRVPLKYIASFLGIRIETLSRIRAKQWIMDKETD